MNKKIIICIIGLMLIGLTGCEEREIDISEKPVIRGIYGDLIEFEPEGTLYIRINDYNMVPYYNEHGKMCHKVDGKIVEFED